MNNSWTIRSSFSPTLVGVFVTSLFILCSLKAEAYRENTLFENIKETYGQKHPILKTNDFCDFPDMQITAKMARAMMNIESANQEKQYPNKKDSHPYISPSRRIKLAEVSFATLLCKQVQFCNKNEILRLCGLPRVKSRNIQCKPTQGVDKENWIYYCGALQLPVRMDFVNDKCTEATVLKRSQLEKFENERAFQIASICKGKNGREIMHMLGQPLRITKIDRATDKWHSMDGQSPIKVAAGDNLWQYEIIEKSEVLLFMRERVCFDSTVEAAAGLGDRTVGENLDD